MEKIANILSVPLRSKKRNRKSGLIQFEYEVRSANYIANYTLLNYLLQYSLFSYKYSHIPINIKLLQLSVNKDYKLADGLKNLKELKIQGKGLIVSPKDKVKLQYEHICKNFPFY